MSCCDAVGCFNYVIDYDSLGFIRELQYNLKAYLDRSFLKIGGWEDVETGVDDCDDVDRYTLTELELPTGLDYRVFGSNRKDWVWEDHEEYNSGNPIEPTIYMDGVDITTGCEIYFPGGYVKTSLDGDIVTASYSYRKVQVYTEYDSEWFFSILKDVYTEKLTDLDTLNRERGIQLPAIVFETSKTSTGATGMGPNKAKVTQDIIFNVICRDAFTRDQMIEILSLQDSTSLNLFNSDGANFPLNCDGTRNDGVLYSDIPTWKCARITFLGSSVIANMSNLQIARVLLRFEIHNPKKPKLN